MIPCTAVILSTRREKRYAGRSHICFAKLLHGNVHVDPVFDHHRSPRVSALQTAFEQLLPARLQAIL
jgi:hypothetical protein